MSSTFEVVRAQHGAQPLAQHRIIFDQNNQALGR